MTKQELQEKIYGFRVSRIILTAFELDIFTALADKSKTSGEVAVQLGTDPRATDRLLNALCILKLVRKKGGSFSNTIFSLRHLVKGKPEYLAGIFHTSRLFWNWADLTDVVNRGKPSDQRRRNAEKAEWQEGFIAAMHDRASPQAARIMNLINARASRHLLDIGGGSGAYTIAFLKSNPAACATFFDLPEVIPISRRYVEAAGLASRTAFRAGNFNTDPLGKGYDLALLSAIIHMQSLKKNRLLFAKIHAALNPGGRLVIQDYIMDSTRLNPEAGVFFALNMLVNTDDGDTFTAGEVKQVLQDSGFVRIRFLETPFPASLAIASKPKR